MIKVVLDTNIIISSVFWIGNPYKVVMKGIKKEYLLLTSIKILDEVVDKLRNKFKFPEDEIENLINVLLVNCQVVESKSRFDIVRDKSDNKILECVVDSDADYIVTGDPDLLEIKNFKGIKIIKARDFLMEI
jgi:uncharacterized protein